jgi:hypothetical protein
VIRAGRISLYREIYTIFPRYLTVPGEYKKNLVEKRIHRIQEVHGDEKDIKNVP